jgi:hypothetical protein
LNLVGGREARDSFDVVLGWHFSKHDELEDNLTGVFGTMRMIIPYIQLEDAYTHRSS